MASYGSERLADYIIIVRGAVRVVRIVGHSENGVVVLAGHHSHEVSTPAGSGRTKALATPSGVFEWPGSAPRMNIDNAREVS